LVASLLAVTSLCLTTATGGAADPVPVILDTDIGPDCDDAGAVAVLNALADLGEARLLAMACCTSNEWGAACIAAINTYYGRPDIPVGTYKGEGFLTESPYAEAVGRAFANPLGSGRNAPDARDLYRQVLAAQPDGSVVFCTIGPLNNARDLLLSEPDGHSPLSGKELIATKVRLLVVMGGGFPGGDEWNFMQDGPAAQSVTREWPGPIVFSGKDIGLAIETGARLATETPESNPVRKAYELYTGGRDRFSWDQTAALYAVRGARGYWDVVAGGQCVAQPDGLNSWREDCGGRHSYLREKMPPGQLARVIEDLMVRPPAAGRQGAAPGSS
jgi:inosine-uridine nucleoside N-ribohydrolase